MQTSSCDAIPDEFWQLLPLNLPLDSTIYADSIYTNYEIEDLLLETGNIKLNSQRKVNSKRP